ncbi:MAG: TIGR04076 family protein [Acidobacteria bacterium]|nr:TIGR04076 family protein [Acidobacteriota bacterium]
MERREFLTAMATTSACAIAPATLDGMEKDAGAQASKKFGVKISVLKRGFEKELVEKLKAGAKGPCTRFSDEQEFTVTSQWAMPDKFCEWAYADIRTYIPMVLGQGNPIAVCCTDGYRPVFFKIERIEL